MPGLNSNGPFYQHGCLSRTFLLLMIAPEGSEATPQRTFHTPKLSLPSRALLDDNIHNAPSPKDGHDSSQRHSRMCLSKKGAL